MTDYILEDGSAGCALPQLRMFAYALGAVIIVAALGIALVQKLRPW